jgi:cell division protein FtsW (lipid II flippase)
MVDKAITPEQEIDIEAHANEVRRWLKRCPERCMASEFLRNYVLLMDAYLLEKKHNKDRDEFPDG